MKITHVLVGCLDEHGIVRGHQVTLEEFAKLSTAEKVYGRPYGPGTYVDTGWYLVPAGLRQRPAE